MDQETDDEEERTADHQGNERADPKECIEGPGGKGPKHDELTMRYVQYPSDPVLEAEPHGDQGVDPAHDETAYDHV